jgi:CIC family chloride channel protein
MDKFDECNENMLPVTKYGKFFGFVSKVAILEAYRTKMKEIVID